MNDDVVRLAAIGQIARRRWRSLAALTVVGALAGAGASLLLSPGYQSSSSILLQGSRSGGDLVTESRIATSTAVLDRTAAALSWGRSGSQLSSSVSAEVTDGNIVQITGTADTPARAKELTDTVVEQYVAYTTQLVTNPADSSAQLLREREEALRLQVLETNKRIDQLHKAASTNALTIESVQARTRLESLRSALSQAVSKLQEAQAVSGRAGIAVIGRAGLPSGVAPPTLPQGIAGGALLFFVATLFRHLVKSRGEWPLDDDSEIATALGSPVLSSVGIATGRRADELSVASTIGDDFRYQQVLAELRGPSDEPLRLLIVVADDDMMANHAVRQFVLELSADERHRAELRVAAVSTTSPAVPEFPDAIGAIIVLTAGTRTAWELGTVADACADAGLEVIGAIVARPERTTGRGRSSSAADEEKAELQASDEAMAGSA